MSKRRFELSEGTAHKFWEIEVVGSNVSVAFGRIGSAGTTNEKSFESPAAAAKAAEKLVAEKTKKGYAEVGSSTATTAATRSDARAKDPAKPQSTQSTSKPIQQLLDTVRAKEKWLVSQLRPPASETAMGALRALDVPSTMSALYEMHDGTDDELVGPYRLLPIESILAERKTMNELLAANPKWAEDGRWDSRWVPFLADGDGQYYCVDPTGTCDGGVPGQILFYDHEAGPQRELRSFDVLVDLLTKLAKKKLLALEARDENRDELDELWADARSAGLPKMPAKRLAAVELQLLRMGAEDASEERKLELLQPLVREYGAEHHLWLWLAGPARSLGRWQLLVEAASTGMRLAPKHEKKWFVAHLCLGLHETGRDEEALAVLRKGLEGLSQVDDPRQLVPEGLAPAFARRALALITEVLPTAPLSVGVWLQRGREATDPEERARLLETVIAVVDGKHFHPGSSTDDMKLEAQRLLERDRIASLSPETRLDAWMAFAERIAGGKSAAAWSDAAACAVELGRWEEAERAGARAIEHTYDHERHRVCRHRVRALHELGRDDEALSLLRGALEQGAYYLDDLGSVPWHEERSAGIVERRPSDAAFEARCLAVVIALRPHVNATPWTAWTWRHRLTVGDGRTAMLEELVSYCAAAKTQFDERGSPYCDEDRKEEVLRLEKEALRELGRG